MRTRAVKDPFFHTCETWSELPSCISAMSMRHGAYLRLYITVESKSFNRFIVLRHLFRSATANYSNFLLKICFLNACETYSKLPNILDSRNEKSKNGRKNIFEMVDE